MAERIAVSSWSFFKHLGPLRGTTLNEHGEHEFKVLSDFPEDLRLLDYPRMVRDRYGVRLVELCQTHFAGSDREYLDELRGRLAEAGVSAINVPIDVGNISDRDEKARRHDVDNIRKWMDVAAYVGAPCARVNSGRFPEGDTDLGITIESYQELAAHAASLGTTLLIENHGGISADPQNIVRLLEGVGSPRFRVCLDFGNFAADVRFRALEMLFPYAVVAHVKTYGFDAQGSEAAYSVEKAMALGEKSGFKGPYSIEFEGEGEQFDGVADSVKLLRRIL
ncbi:MAG: sugar phosphate isomerase/epimerase family protein [Anaerolineae bacterium]